MLFGNGKKSAPKPIPAGFTAASVRVEASICTGERTIGFYDPSDKKLHYSELVRSEKDIADFYRKYGIEK